MSSKRQLQVGEIIRRNISTVLLEQGRYIYGSALVTVTKVKMSPDMAQAKIFCSVYNANDKSEVIGNLNAAYWKLKSNLVVRIRKHVRRIPEFRFYIDETLDEMYRLNALFDKLHDENQMGEEE